MVLNCGSMYKCCFKRIIDFCIAFVALSVLFLPLIIVSLWLRFANRGAGILFFQERPGKEGKIFRVIKFKTMTDERDTNGNLLPDAQRMTKVGRFVRSTSIDELPQLINVLKGDMALIGPRPLLPQYLSLYSKEQARRHEVRPGITGWAQVTGFRGETKKVSQMEGRVKRDLWYIENWTFLLDLRIMVMTVVNMFRGEKNAY